MLRKIFTFGITLLLMFSFVSCGDKNEIEEIDPEGISSREDIPIRTEQEDVDHKTANKETSVQSSEPSNTNEESSVESSNTQSISTTTILVTPISTSSGNLASFYIQNENSKTQIHSYLSNLGNTVAHEPYMGANIFLIEVTSVGETKKYQLTSEVVSDGKYVLSSNDNWYHVPADFWKLMIVIYPDFDTSSSTNMPDYIVSIMDSNKTKSAAYAYFASEKEANDEDTIVSSYAKSAIDKLSPVNTAPATEGLKYCYVSLETFKDSSTQNYCCYENGYVKSISSGKWYKSETDIYNYVSSLLG